MGSGMRDSNARSGQEPSAGSDLSQMSMASWAASGDGERNGKSHGQPEARGFSSVSDVSLASWGASEGVGGEDSIPEAEPEEAPQPRYSGAQTLAGLGFPSGSSFAEYAAPSGADQSKHDELADAVESALRSVYGEQPAKPAAAKPFQKPAIAAGKGRAQFGLEPEFQPGERRPDTSRGHLQLLRLRSRGRLPQAWGTGGARKRRLDASGSDPQLFRLSNRHSERQRLPTRRQVSFGQRTRGAYYPAVQPRARCAA